MTRRETLLKLSGITGFPVLLGSCNMDAVRRAESNLGWRMKRPGTGVQFSGLPEVVKVIINATYPATPQQTQVAQQRARKAVATIARREGKAATVTKKKDSGKPATIVGGATAGAGGTSVAPAPAEEAKTAAAVLEKQTGSPIIAVDTQPDNRLQGDRAVMLWNTQSQRLVGNNVYDVSAPPAKGQVAQWGSVTARYVGSGSL
jgi:hypothetical protein